MKASSQFKEAVREELKRQIGRRTTEQQNRAFRTVLRPLPSALNDLADVADALSKMASAVNVVGRQSDLQDEASQIAQTLKAQAQALRNVDSALSRLT